MLNNNSLTVTRVDRDQTYTVKLQTMHFNGEESILIFLQDISYIQQLRERETKDRLTTMYSANVSHEMRTPLSTCINFTDLLLTTIQNPVQRKHLEIIKFSSVMMLNNVNDTLDNAQIERGTFTPKDIRCSLKNAV
jgi:signal transduction histidine kinase